MAGKELRNAMTSDENGIGVEWLAFNIWPVLSE